MLTLICCLCRTWRTSFGSAITDKGMYQEYRKAMSKWPTHTNHLRMQPQTVSRNERIVHTHNIQNRTRALDLPPADFFDFLSCLYRCIASSRACSVST
mmetsp:Transcript_45126/g.72153  ORF Transcript_45126/g.72153 Transcript_45126/m.72153 type:complete len:98 (+) Transcript_45126:557-850(+)